MRHPFVLLYGIFSHITFLAAILAMYLWLLYGGFGVSREALSAQALIVDLLLVLQFPLLHSWLLTAKGRKLLGKIGPVSRAKDLSTTHFAFISSLQLLITFLLWRPLGAGKFVAQGSLYWVLLVVFNMSWLILGKAMADAGLAVQTGFLGWSSVCRREKPKYPSFGQTGLYRYTRHPIYWSFLAILVTSPYWTLDKVIIASLWGLYCIFGPLLKEQRYRRFYAGAYEKYEREISYFFGKKKLKP